MMWSRPVRGLTAVVAVAGIAGLLAGCNNSDDSAASAESSSTPWSSIDPKLKVKVPLPTDVLLKNPCDVITAKQAAVIGIEPKGEFRNVVGPACQWVSSGNRQNFTGLDPETMNKGGLSDIYAQKAEQKYFIPTTVDGYPALYADKIDARPSGSCVLWVGVTDQLAVAASADIGAGRNRSKPCTISLKMAQAMVATMKSEL
jgi:hypothetical protein